MMLESTKLKSRIFQSRIANQTRLTILKIQTTQAIQTTPIRQTTQAIQATLPIPTLPSHRNQQKNLKIIILATYFEN